MIIILNKVIWKVKNLVQSWIISHNLERGDLITEPNEVFFRRVFWKDRRYIDKKIGKFTSRSFTPRPKDDGKLSVDLKRLTTVEKSLNYQPERFILGTIINEDVLSLGLKFIYDPTNVKDDGFDNIAHCVIKGIPEDDESIAGILARKFEKIGES